MLISSIRNFTKGEVNKNFLKQVAEKVLEEEKIRGNVGLSLVIVGEGRMRALNRKYRKKNRATDVLAFGENPKSPPSSRLSAGLRRAGKIQNPKVIFVEPPDNVLRLGEIVICPRVVKKNARRFKSGFSQELARVFIHGILHLLGYDHEKNGDETGRMAEKEGQILKRIDIAY